MSRIGKLAIKLEPKVKASVASGAVAFEGPKGKMKVSLPQRITADVKDGQIHVQRPDDTREARALHGLARSLLANAARGVASGWERKLDIRGGHQVRRRARAPEGRQDRHRLTAAPNPIIRRRRSPSLPDGSRTTWLASNHD